MIMLKNNSNLNDADSRQYILMLQEIIIRMANNSSNCKVWTVTIVAAMMGLAMTTQSLREIILPVILIPIIVFYFLDSYYLYLENKFRNLQAAYISKLKSDIDCSGDIYNFNYRSIEENPKKACLRKALFSMATWPMYLALLLTVMICIYGCRILKEPTKHIQDIETPLNEISCKQDSIYSSVNKLTKAINSQVP